MVGKDAPMFVLLMLFWIILNGKITLEILLIGALLSALLYWVACQTCGFSIQKDLQGVRCVPRVLRYLLVLVWNIFLSNIQVIRIVLRPKIHVSPAIVTMQVPLHSSVNRFILANSITLTPGTITVRIDDHQIAVHALDTPFAEGVDNSAFVRELQKWEARDHAAK
jgi:multicomponent Na+:H+ antiporter subunit E